MQDIQVKAPAYGEPLFEEVPLPRRTVVRHIHTRSRYLFAKRLFDLVFGALLLILSAPLWLLVAVLIRLTSTGPAVYGQIRVGKDGRLFTCYKFRTMVDGAHDLRHILLHENQMNGPVFKTPDDPRVTRIGHWLRKTSIDELPQLLNVLRGDMSVVGPRPQSPEEVDQYGAQEWGRLSMKPGLTCIWQVSGRALVQEDKRMQMDLQYVRRCSFVYDCLLVLRTIPAVITGRGAF